jgi:hypothetical protein
VITIKPATRESRPRDRKRFRAVLAVGKTFQVHLTIDELLDLAADAVRTAFTLSKREVLAKQKAGRNRRPNGGK